MVWCERAAQLLIQPSHGLHSEHGRPTWTSAGRPLKQADHPAANGRRSGHQSRREGPSVYAPPRSTLRFPGQPTIQYADGRTDGRSEARWSTVVRPAHGEGRARTIRRGGRPTDRCDAQRPPCVRPSVRSIRPPGRHHRRQCLRRPGRSTTRPRRVAGSHRPAEPGQHGRSMRSRGPTPHACSELPLPRLSSPGRSIGPVRRRPPRRRPATASLAVHTSNGKIWTE